MLILPGSANLFGGRSVTLKNVPSRTIQGMKFPGAPYGLKMACGENPKRVYGTKNQPPATRMGNVAGYRKAWLDAAKYAKKWEAYRASEGKGDAPDRDLKLDTLAGVLNGEILVQNHCYRADEMAVMIDIAKEFGYKISAFHHGSEAYKIADLLAKEGICVATWAGWWGFKIEVDRRHRRKRGPRSRGRRLRRHPLRRSDPLATPEPRGRRGPRRRATHRPEHLRSRRHQMDHGQPRQDDGHPRQDRHA